MIKLNDFARQMGVTERAIQKHLRKYAAELEGTYERKGPNGTWLTEEACEILRSKMKQGPPPAIFDADPRVEQLQAKVAELEQQLREKEALLTVQQQLTQDAQKRVQELLVESLKVKALEEGQKALEAKLAASERDKEDMRNAPLWQRLKGFKKWKTSSN